MANSVTISSAFVLVFTAVKILFFTLRAREYKMTAIWNVYSIFGLPVSERPILRFYIKCWYVVSHAYHSIHICCMYLLHHLFSVLVYNLQPMHIHRPPR